MGSESTATTLSGAVFSMLTKRGVCQHLENEIRSSFTKENILLLRAHINLLRGVLSGESARLVVVLPHDKIRYLYDL